MKGAAQAGALEAAEGQVSAPVRTVSIDQSIAIFSIAKQDQVFT
jgi:hypothetical protein